MHVNPKIKEANIFIGTSNITLPGNKFSFPEAFQNKSRLFYYSSLFNTLEVNSSFYKIPMETTFKKWATEVPDNFRFSVKLHKQNTHTANLPVIPELIIQFLHAADGLQNKRGCLLIQFPGKINLNYYLQVEKILKTVSSSNLNDCWKIAIEFRHPSWFVGETMELLDEYKASIVLHDIPKSKNQIINKKAPFVYIRFHGPTGDYRGNYDEKFLKDKSQEIKNFLNKGKHVYAYFNNTIGDAYNNALRLKVMMEE